MPADNVKRKLTAILCADDKGYSRMMGEDEVGTFRTLSEYLNVIKMVISDYRGRVFSSPGDAILAQFVSVVDAVECAVAIQDKIEAENIDVPEEQKMRFRIGINLGDVIEDGAQIYGDGVNIAARIESLAEPGKVSISKNVYNNVQNKLKFGYEYQGTHKVKNISEPIKIYKLLTEPEAANQLVKKPQLPELKTKKVYYAIFATLVLVAAAWYLFPRGVKQDPTSMENIISPIADRPSIAVLPFSNLSGDPEQEYFSDGLTNDIITDLSRFRELFVVSSNTIFTFKGKPVKVQDVGSQLNVRYVLEGSVQRVGDNVRINVQLIDADSDYHLWSSRYDRDFNDIFALQNEIVQTIVRTLAIQIDVTERERAMRKNTDNLASYDHLLRGWHHYYRHKQAENIKAREMFKKAIALDAGHASAYVGLAATRLNDFLYGWTEFHTQALQQAHDFARKAVELDAANAHAHRLLGAVYRRRLQYDLSINAYELALKLNPNDAESIYGLGSVLFYDGRLDEAIKLIETALNYNLPSGPGNFMHLGMAYYLNGKYDDAINKFKKGVSRYPNFAGNYVGLAAAYAQLDQVKNASIALGRVFKLAPFFNIDNFGSAYRNPADRDKIVQGLHKAGLK